MLSALCMLVFSSTTIRQLYHSLNVTVTVIIYTHAKKRRPPLALYEVRLICTVFRNSLTGQRYLDEVFYPHVLQIYQTLGSNYFFQQDNVSMPAIWQGTVCKLLMSYPLDRPSLSRSISDLTPLGYSRPADT